jgi:hypothetical protein
MLTGMSESADSPLATRPDRELTERIRRLEAQMVALAEAVEVLVRGLESTPLAEPVNHHVEEAARKAHELLLLAKSAAMGGGPGGAA